MTTVQEKVERIARLGIDHVVIAHFDEAYTRRTAASFIEELEKLGPLGVFVGNDFQFGSKRAGDTGLLARHFPVHIPEPVHCSDGQTISSSIIRLLISAGETQKSVSLLGW